MIYRQIMLAAAASVAIGLGSLTPTLAHGPGYDGPQPAPGWHYGWHHGWHMQPGMMGPQGHGCPMMQGHVMMRPGMVGPGMMGQGMMGPGMGMMGPGMGMMGPGMGPGMMAPGMQGPGMGPGMMAPGMQGPGMQGPGTMGGMMQPSDQTVTTDDVTRMLEQHLAWQGNPRLKVGKVEQADDDTIVGEIVTQDGALVDRFEVDRRTGWSRRAP